MSERADNTGVEPIIARSMLMVRTGIASPTGRAFALYAIAFACAGLTPFILLPVLTARLEPTEFGQATSWIVAATMVANLLGLTVHGLVSVRYFKVTPAHMRRIVGACLLIVAVTHLAGMLYFSVGPDPVGAFTHLPRAFSIGATVIAMTICLNLVMLALMQASQRPGLYLAMRLIQSTIEIAGCFILLRALGGVPDARILSYGVAMLASAACGLACLAWRSPLWAAPRGVDIRDALRFGIPMLPHVVAGQLLSNVDRLMVSFVMGAQALGIFMVASQLGLAISVVVEPLNRALAPWLFKQLASGDVADKSRIVRATYWLFGGLMALALCAAGLFWAAFGTLFGPEYIEARLVIFPIAVGMAFQGMYYGVVNYVFYAEATARLSLVTTSVVLAGSALSFVAVTRLGILGAGVSFMVTNALLFVCVWRLSHRVVPMPWFRAGGTVS